MVTHRLNLNLVPDEIFPRLKVSQLDKGEKVEIFLYYGMNIFLIQDNTIVLVQGIKPDGNVFQYDCTYENNKVITTLTEQMTAVAGEVRAELVLKNNAGDRIATCDFILCVKQGTLSDDSVISDSALPKIEEAVEVAESIAQETARETAESIAQEIEQRLGNYENLTNKPKLNGVEMVGDMAETDPTVPDWVKQSDIEPSEVAYVDVLDAWQQVFNG